MLRPVTMTRALIVGPRERMEGVIETLYGLTILHIDEKAAGAEGEAGELREKILALELNISEEDAAKKKTQGLLADLQRRIEEIRPFALLPLSLADYRGYESLEVLVGRVPREIAGLESVTRGHEAFLAPDLLPGF